MAERAELGTDLLASFDGETEPEAEAAWAAEIERRARRVLAGEASGTDWREVLRRIKSDVLGN